MQFLCPGSMTRFMCIYIVHCQYPSSMTIFFIPLRFAQGQRPGSVVMFNVTNLFGILYVVLKAAGTNLESDCHTNGAQCPS